ncbi:retron St85 family effector protein [Arhodomonas aquaeolei]|uniref:retron St85 family effector protein n=1 Tax=Arhodomonas aquaeolei TaxID=2369 RepID=UPI0021685174|nr:retron St85 family effector protein [Arhodomonas aquaeolei]MCS4503965.1 retron St85 family effector protein [Arhodomonas aquaeolei]
MEIIKDNPTFNAPREKLKEFFSRGDLFYSRDAHLCFVCGRSEETQGEHDMLSMRSMFVDHIDANNDLKIICVRAETAATELLRQIDERGKSISTFERTIAENVDSVLIFPESAGSIAELGYFSAHNEVAEKTLVAILEEHQRNSFLYLGPIHVINKHSRFAPLPFVLAGPNEERMRKIAERLLGESINKRPYRERFEYSAWKDIKPRHQLVIIDEMIDIISPTTEPDLRHCIEFCFGAYDISQIRLQLAILVATHRITRNDDGDIYRANRDVKFFECDSKVASEELRLEWNIASDDVRSDAEISFRGSDRG